MQLMQRLSLREEAVSGGWSDATKSNDSLPDFGNGVNIMGVMINGDPLNNSLRKADQFCF